MSGTPEVWHAHKFDRVERKRPYVLVIGAGIAGLTTAYELERRQFRVDILESNSRIGGRVHTHRFGTGPGAPSVELGAMRIPDRHRLTLEYIDRMGLTGKLRTFSTLLSEENAFLHTDGGFVRIRDASGPLCAAFRAGLAGQGPGPGGQDPTVVFGAWLTAIVDAIAPPDLREALRADLRHPLLDLVSRIDPAPHLRGAARDRIDLHSLFSAHPGIRSGCSGRLNSFLDDILTETSPALLRLDGGMDQLPGRLAARLKGRILRGRRVTGIDVRDDEVLVRVRGTARTTVRRADFVVCTVPFPALRQMRLRGLDDDKRAVLDDVVYCPATKVALHCREPFWHDEGIRGGASFIGGLIRQTYYPPVDGAPGRGAALLASYTIGDEAELLGRLPARRRHRVVIEELAAAHPQLRAPGMVLGATSAAWGHSRGSVGCATRWGKSAAACEEERRRAARPVGRLFFAGEHCSDAPAWIEGAIASALDAVNRLVHYVPGPRPVRISGGRGRGRTEEVLR
ncbi:FAD-dependent oxidoreductase [Streptomyces sp. AV19]|uniref:flavin monoamine oxidase family protein n=1 Tax=Streptomyces sp. AV19 TaxID=2793068 RepID=UPI0018FE56AA|nr:NAD(P)/FAD-dependent oxidoreductase [Streptomyces sp. AV19]MBH1938225.1 FAD-dependent oxidoreductase [Streptomyces sp. AV19]MDG4534855.1 FAD-dependent oxidoreductase [Streptomyces sp. AV19]